MDSALGCDVRRAGGRGVGLIRAICRQAFVVYVAINMALCSVVFAPWAMPRETISGLLGRWLLTETGIKRAVAVVIGALVDSLYFWEPDHCRETYKIEKRAREILYP
jgi:hypothetical protein